jgi:hypothetical protein
MARSSLALERALVELAWSHWTELGVSGWQVGSSVTGAGDVAVDPEPLIFLTASLGAADPRLRDEATDWCVAFGRYISKVRLKNLLRFGIGDRPSYADFAATVNRHARLGWPNGDEHGRAFKPTHRSELAVRGRPASIRLRARLLFGVSARAEILVILASEQWQGSTATELAERARYGRRNVVEALDALVTVGLVRQVEAPTARRYRLADPIAVQSLLGPVPAHAIDWAIAFDACWLALSTLRAHGDAAPTVRSIEAVKAAEAISRRLARSWLTPPPRAPSGISAWERLEPWALNLVQMLRDPALARFAPRRAASGSRRSTVGSGERAGQRRKKAPRESVA